MQIHPKQKGALKGVINSSAKIYAYVTIHPHEEHIFTC
jgi:hypothetical protein